MEICYASVRLSASPLPFRSRLRAFSTPKTLKSDHLLNFVCDSLLLKSEKERSKAANRMFILGMGFVGQFFGDQLKRDGWEVSGTCTSMMKKKKLEELGFDVYLFDANEPDLRNLNVLEYATHLLVSIPPVVGACDLVLRHRHLLQSILSQGNLVWLGYLSSTSVYGDCKGAWADEDYPTNPMRKSAKARLAAEKEWLDLGHDLGVSVQVFRLGGIYGPGRSALDTIIKQECLSKGQRMREAGLYTSRVHVADICQALKASIATPSSGKIYNIVDDDPARRSEVFSYAHALVEERWPGHIEQSSSPDVADIVIQNKNTRGEKRVSNGLLKTELGVRLLHPTYRSGIQSIIDQMENPFM